MKMAAIAAEVPIKVTLVAEAGQLPAPNHQAAAQVIAKPTSSKRAAHNLHLAVRSNS